ncbi:DUF3775 domain-containing protein [Arenibaculum pallidiluteum]|uniref:DUF3775 domain-containing protein n=1 Tax=Arenibaculum pallidiluteum TaxID=2812559 RepID=UPI001A96AF64|nr:DUF3775 domain-containing protein [Arenibaculum pallidiluteum]
MLSKLSLDEVKRVHDLSLEALAARDRLVNKVYQADLGDQPLERGSRMPTDLDNLDVLNAVDSAEYRALKDYIEGLDSERREELKALMLIGRGDHAPAEWDEALAAARTIPQAGDADYLAEKASLSQYLMKGLYGIDRKD